MAKASLPSVSLSGSKGSIRLDPTGLLLEQDGTRRRIPLPAVAEVRVDPSGRAASVVLTAPDGTEATRYRIAGPNVASVTAFARAVNAALPERAPGARLGDGADLVEVLDAPAAARIPARQGVEPLLVLIVVACAVPVIGYLAGLVQLIVVGRWFGLVLYVLGVKPLVFGAAGIAMGAHALYIRAVLLRRGVSVVANPGSKSAGKLRCHFTDAEGVTRSVEVNDASVVVDRKVHLAYDPRNPSRAVGRLPVHKRILYALGVALAFPLLALGLFMVPYQVYLSLR
ncbi:hypothetical protein OG711_15980 [Streptomyces uncialis]|uniref:hypothetical protein n=1 Tax=Streptomyces uncialis TaxID=1048205 RepID=UPI002E3441A9|nr:hypothetical protein [Streptomyces uncialis]